MTAERPSEFPGSPPGAPEEIVETPFFFPNGRYRLFGVLHAPGPDHSPERGDALPLNDLGLVFCHPFAEEKLISHRILVSLARHLARRGIRCLRFDYMGHGDSEGDFDDSSVETRLADIEAAINHLRARAGGLRIGLLGLRLGAALAAYAAGRVKGVDPLILIAPVLQGKPYIENALRANLTAQMMVHRKVLKDRSVLIQELLEGTKVYIDGYPLTRELYTGVSELDLAAGVRVGPGRALVLQVARGEAKALSKDLLQLQAAWRDLKVEIEL
jgi:uncharacterized protein